MRVSRSSPLFQFNSSPGCIGTGGLGIGQSSSEPQISLIRVVEFIGALKDTQTLALPIPGTLIQRGFWSCLDQGRGRSGLIMSLCTWVSFKRFKRGRLDRFFGSSRHSKMGYQRSGLSGLDSCFLLVNAYLAVDPPDGVN